MSQNTKDETTEADDMRFPEEVTCRHTFSLLHRCHLRTVNQRRTSMIVYKVPTIVQNNFIYSNVGWF